MRYFKYLQFNPEVNLSSIYVTNDDCTKGAWYHTYKQWNSNLSGVIHYINIMCNSDFIELTEADMMLELL